MTDEHPEVVPDLEDGTPIEDDGEPEDAGIEHGADDFEWDPDATEDEA